MPAKAEAGSAPQGRGHWEGGWAVIALGCDVAVVTERVSFGAVSAVGSLILSISEIGHIPMC